MPEESYPDKPFAIIGEEDVVSGFQALGFGVYPVKEESAAGVLAEAVRHEAAIVLVQEEIYQQLKGEIGHYRDLPLPVFIPFARDAGMSLLGSLVKDMRLRAIGTF